MNKEEAQVSVPAEAEPATGENGYGAWEEIKPNGHMSTEDIEWP